jgi:outer membrane receptor protein involved in Fe transport
MSGAPQGFFEVNYLGLPEYNLNQETSQFLIEHQLTDDLVINAGAHHKDRAMNRVSGYSSPEMQTFRFNDTSMMFPWGFKGVPQSGYGPGCNIDDGTAGVYGGCFKDDGVILDYPTGFNANNFVEEMDVAEIRLTSNYDGKFNFMVGGLTSTTEGEYTYDVIATGLEALSLTYANPIFRFLTGSTAGAYPSMFQTGDRSKSESKAFFGELYIQQSDDLRITLGLRQTDDDKSSYTRQAFLDTTGTGGIGSGFTADPGSSGIPGFGEAFRATTGKEPVMDFSKTTGRLVVDYFVSEDMMVYGSLSTGFKGGGFNPAIDPLCSQILNKRSIL